MEIYTVEDGATELFFMFDFAGRPKHMSNPSPKNTRATPNHCLPCSGLLKMSTEPRMVKNFLVVVKMEQVRGPKLLMVVNMKFCTFLRGECVCVRGGNVCECVWLHKLPEH